MSEVILRIDDQPIAADFFSQGRWLTDWITPDALEIGELHRNLTKGITAPLERITACWKWVASEVKYVKFVRGRIWINGKSSTQNDLWTLPNTTVHTHVGNCAVKSFLLTSLLRRELPVSQVYCVLGNLYNGKPGGHAWVSLKLDGDDYIMESTMPTGPPLVRKQATQRYEAVHYFNDKVVLAVEDKTQLIPMTACYSTWLSDYLHWAYIEGQRGR